MIPAGVSELRSAFWNHTHAHNRDGSLHLILFYAVECGLKSVYLRRNQLLDTSRIADPDLKRSHDLAHWVKELRLPAAVAMTRSSFRLQRDKTSHEIAQAHEAWRYGVGILDEDETALIDYLQTIRRWIEEALQR